MMEKLVHLIKNVLDKEEYVYISKKIDDEELFMLSFQHSNVAIILSEDGEFINIVAKGNWEKELLYRESDKYKMKLFQDILKENYRRKLVKWSFDYDDGDLTVGVELPLEDATLTEKQFLRSFNSVVGHAEEMFGKIDKNFKNNIQE